VDLPSSIDSDKSISVIYEATTMVQRTSEKRENKKYKNQNKSRIDKLETRDHNPQRMNGVNMKSKQSKATDD